LGERNLGSLFRAAGKTDRKPGAKVKLLLIGGFVGLAIGVGLTILYFSLATFFAVNASALNAKQKTAEMGNESAEDSVSTDRRKAGRVGERVFVRSHKESRPRLQRTEAIPRRLTRTSPIRRGTGGA